MLKGRGADHIHANELSWVPQAALNYLAHTEGGTSIRALARRMGCHASTVSRQVRALEALRDDLLVDEALRRLGPWITSPNDTGSCIKERHMTGPIPKDTAPSGLTETRLNREALRILRRMCETGAVLAVAAEMDKAVVVRETAAGQNRTAVVDRDIAEALALKSWIHCETPGRISRYRITAQGRSALSCLMAQQENKLSGSQDTEAAFLGQDPDIDTDDAAEDSKPRRMRYGVVETPLILLSRRRAQDGSRFLSDCLVRAGETLREDFEIGQLSDLTREEWDDILSGAQVPDLSADPCSSHSAARARVFGALRDLGPGLGDVALRCCCFLEGLETTEKKLGWSARSGKIVLRIALQRLKRHYASLGDSAGLMG